MWSVTGAILIGSILFCVLSTYTSASNVLIYSVLCFFCVGTTWYFFKTREKFLEYEFKEKLKTEQLAVERAERKADNLAIHHHYNQVKNPSASNNNDVLHDLLNVNGNSNQNNNNQNPIGVMKTVDAGSVFRKLEKPKQFTKSTDIKLWWKRYANFVKNNKLECSQAYDYLLDVMDSECFNKFHYLQDPHLIKTMDNLEKELFRILARPDLLANNARLKFYARFQMDNESLEDYMTALFVLGELAWPDLDRAELDTYVSEMCYTAYSKRQCSHLSY